jgi:hypothetical protein
MRAMIESKHCNLIMSCAHWAQRLPKLNRHRLSADCSWISDWKCGLVNFLLLLLAPQGFLIYTFENLRSIYIFVPTIMEISRRHHTYIIDQLCFYSMYENYILLVVIFAKCTVKCTVCTVKSTIKHSQKHSLHHVYLYLITCFAIPFTWLATGMNPSLLFQSCNSKCGLRYS